MQFAEILKKTTNYYLKCESYYPGCRPLLRYPIIVIEII